MGFVNDDYGTIIMISLESNGYYFLQGTKTVYYHVSREMKVHTGISRRLYDVVLCELGRHGSYILGFSNEHHKWNLKGLYPDLKAEINKQVMKKGKGIEVSCLSSLYPPHLVLTRLHHSPLHRISLTETRTLSYSTTTQPSVAIIWGKNTIDGFHGLKKIVGQVALSVDLQSHNGAQQSHRCLRVSYNRTS
jgi:hypothetical protein